MAFIRNTGAKFIGRAIYRWGDEKVLTEPGFWAGAEALIDEVHAFDSDVIFQAATFEAVYREVGEVPVPAWAFEALGLPAEERNFDYAQMLAPDGKYVDLWAPGASVPDITRVETQLWLMYLIGSYVDIGVEAVHLGQVYLMGMNDRDWQAWDSFLKKVRAWVYPRARRHFVLFDAHAGSRGMMVGERSLVDFNSFPLRIREVPDEPMKCVLEKGHIDAIFGKSPACVTPAGGAMHCLTWSSSIISASATIRVWPISMTIMCGATTRSHGFTCRISPPAARGCATLTNGCARTIRTDISKCQARASCRLRRGSRYFWAAPSPKATRCLTGWISKKP